jgi:hypothetical protein
MDGVSDLLHLFELVYNRGVEFVLVGKVPFKIATSGECLWTERAAVPSGKPTEEPMEVEVVNWQSLQWRRGKSLRCIQMLRGIWERFQSNVVGDKAYSI